MFDNTQKPSPAEAAKQKCIALFQKEQELIATRRSLVALTAAAEAGSPAVASAATVAPTSPTAPCSPASGPDLAAALEPTPDSSDQQAAQQVGQLLCQLVG